MNKIRRTGEKQGVLFLSSIITSFCILLPTICTATLRLEKTHELHVRGFYISNPNRITGISSWTSIESGYILKTPFNLYIYSHDLTLIKKIPVGELSERGVLDIAVSNDTLLYVLESRAIDLYNLSGVRLNRWRYPASHIAAQNLTVHNNRLILGGQRYWFASPKRLPEFLLYDFEAEDDPIAFTKFYPDSLLNPLDDDVDKLLSVSVTDFEEGFVAVGNLTPQVFIFSHSGKLKEVITDTPPGHRGLLDAPEFDFRRVVQDANYNKEWNDSWDYTSGWFGIRVIDDSLLLVPRRLTRPYCIDIYNLQERHFVQRVETDAPLIGAGNGRLFFADSLNESFLKISAYRIVWGASNELPDSVKREEGCTFCGRELGRYEYIETPNMDVDTVTVGNDRIAIVLNNGSFKPDSLVQFCAKDKKNMFVFMSPEGLGGDEVLIDSLSRCLYGRTDWMLTTIVCFPKPEELSLYLLDLPGDQIFINRNVAIPDSTIELSDLGLPPIALAFSEGGNDFIAGYSLAPNYVSQKNGRGITFEEFLRKCEIIGN